MTTWYQIGIGAALLLLAVLLYKPLDRKILSFRRNLRTRGEERQKFEKAFERLVTDMEAYRRDCRPINNMLCLRIIRRFDADLSTAKRHIKKSVYDVALATIVKVKEDCENKTIDVPYLQAQYETAMKRKHPTVETEEGPS